MADIPRAIDYDDYTTGMCERAVLTLLKCAGPWWERIYLAGGLVPCYLITELPDLARPHVGTTDVDLVVGVAVLDEGPEPYETLVANMRKAGFDIHADEAGRQQSFRWSVVIDGKIVLTGEAAAAFAFTLGWGTNRLHESLQASSVMEMLETCFSISS